jgi:hypothetical protein
MARIVRSSPHLAQPTQRGVEAREYDRSALILDTADRRLSRISLSLIALGHTPLYAADLDELILIAQEHRGQVGAVLLPAAEAVTRCRAVRERIVEPFGLSARSVLPVGAPLPGLEADALYAQGVRWALWQPYSPWELRFAVGMVLSDTDPNETRLEARVPCAIAVSIESHNRASSGQLTDLSPAGAFVQLDHPYPEGTAIELHASLLGRDTRLRARVAWRSGSHTPGWCDTGIGIVFEGISLDTLALLRRQVESSLDRFRIRPRAAAEPQLATPA